MRYARTALVLVVLSVFVGLAAALPARAGESADADWWLDDEAPSPEASQKAVRVSATTGQGLEELQEELAIRLFGKAGRTAPWMRHAEDQDEEAGAVLADDADSGVDAEQ